MDRVFGRGFRAFNRFFERSSAGYGRTVTRLTQRKGAALVVYAGLVALAIGGFAKVPTGFVPTQDKQYLIAFAQLPDAATLDRTESVIARMAKAGLAHPAVADAIEFPGLSINGFVNSPNSGIIFFGLKSFEERTEDEDYGPAVAAALTQRLGAIQDAYIAVFPPPAVNGIGQMGGFKLQLEDRASVGEAEMARAVNALVERASKAPELAGVFSGYQTNVPQLFADVDREKVKRQGIALTDVFQTLQVYLGSQYVNDFSRFGRTYRVVAQADAPYRADAAALGRLEVPNARGEMVPLGTLMTVRETSGPDRVVHYNAYPSAEINGGPAPGYSSDQATAAMERLARETLPNGIGYEWTDLTYQQILAGNTALFVFPLCVLLAFLVLAAQYESWTLPLAVILIVPMCLLSAIAGVWLSRGDNNVFTQIGLVVLVGLACKNAILIVEFARELEDRGMTALEAALEASRLRLRPILMTSLAFIMGVVPLVISRGAGSEMRRAMGVAVFSGMLGVTVFGLLLTPVFYVVLRGMAARRAERRVSDAPPAVAAAHAEATSHA
jgi:multidrug efflux pump